MISLFARCQPFAGIPRVLRVTRDASARGSSLLLIAAEPQPDVGLCFLERTSSQFEGVPLLPAELGHLRDGDVVRVVPERGEISVLFRKSSRHNSVLLTEQCNSNCVMCSQPPRRVDDAGLAVMWTHEVLPLLPPDTAELGISGGEPTLLGDVFLDFLRACRARLPETSIHLLSNGRTFRYLSLAREVAAVGLRDLVVGVPVYSDLPDRHDFVVQAAGAFDQTIRGLINLKRCGIRVEIRVVLHRGTIDRLPQLARFIARNLAFADHVALMGLELMGFGKTNAEALWVDPLDYASALERAVQELEVASLETSIYNHQLCVLPRSLWSRAVQSISDWKNDYVDECRECVAKERCGGFFSSGLVKRSRGIRPVHRGDLVMSLV